MNNSSDPSGARDQIRRPLRSLFGVVVVWLAVGLASGPGHATWFANYQSLAAYHQKLDEFANQYPALASPVTIGLSHEGRVIRGIRLAGTGPAQVARKAVVLNGLLHAREWVAGMVPMYVADQLLSRYGTDPRVTRVLNNVDVFVFPVMNPDGYEYSRNVNRYWRKNRRPNSDGSFGVDLNRNFGYGWGLNSGSSGTPSSETYRGPAPFSEPETQALRNFFVTQQHVVGHLDFHNYSQQILFPWGYTAEDPPDQALLLRMAATMAASILAVHGKVYEHDDPFLYLSSGTARDWTYGDQGAYAFTVELRPESVNPGFDLPPSEIIPTGQELFPATLDLADYVIKMANGDFDANDAFRCDDVDKLVKAIVQGSNKAELDLTGDGLINMDDLQDWRVRAGNAQLGPGRVFLPGDANLDGQVDLADFQIWNTYKFTTNPAWCRGDFNADGVVDGRDFSLWNRWNGSSSLTSSAVPEPIWFTGVACALAIGARRSKPKPHLCTLVRA